MSPKKNHDIPKGFVAGGVSAGIKPGRKPDLGMILCERPALTVALTTTNRFPAAPIEACRVRLRHGRSIRGIVVNSANANAMTGKQGLADALAMASAAEEATGCLAGSFLVASTGIIGRSLPVDKIESAIPKLADKLSSDGWDDFARAIMTTDTRPKLASRGFRLKRLGTFRVLGIAKGVGMIEPNMATMLAFIMTDYPLSVGRAKNMLVEATDVSFHCLTVDAQRSTNDMVTLTSSEAGEKTKRRPAGADEKFLAALTGVCRDLARDMAADGEGASKLITVRVTGTNRHPQARKIARAVANSPLVKTAIFAENPNWGRIIQAIGQSDVPFAAENVTVKLQGTTLVRRGEPVEIKLAELRNAMRASEIVIDINVGGGKGAAEIWTCDLTPGYIKINAEYN